MTTRSFHREPRTIKSTDVKKARTKLEISLRAATEKHDPRRKGTPLHTLNKIYIGTVTILNILATYQILLGTTQFFLLDVLAQSS